jgi:hypothetical protein
VAKKLVWETTHLRRHETIIAKTADQSILQTRIPLRGLCPL